MKALDLQGSTFGNLTVVCRAGRNPSNGNARWKCSCSCGGITIVDSQNLKNGRVRSCGCAYKTHGKSKSPEYFAWATMVQRCTNPKSASFKNYGGRGITVDEPWLKYENFLKDMGPRPNGKTLDRIDNDGPYCRSNCRWASKSEQESNKRVPVTARMITMDGKTMTVSQWARVQGLKPSVVFRRLYLGWSEARALEIKQHEWVAV